MGHKGAKVAKRGAMFLSEFPLQTATVRSYHEALLNGLKIPGVVRKYLQRVTDFDHKLNAVASKVGISRAVKTSIQFQQTWDTIREKEGDMNPFLKRKPLFGVYLCAKDNIVTRGLPTRAGSMALKESVAIRQDISSPIIERLFEAGATVLVKGNMHELGMAGMTLSSSLGQTRNPWDLTRTPGGSSGGVAVAIAAGYAVAGIGTDTMNSIRSPASACNLVGFRPSKGALDMDGIVPVAPSQDAVGPITKNVDDARLLFNVMAGQAGFEEYRSQKTNWDGLKIGVLDTYGPEDERIEIIFENALRQISNSGAKMVRIKIPEWDIEKLKALDVQKYEFAKAFERFMTEAISTDEKDPPVNPPMKLEDILQREKDRIAEEEAKALLPPEPEPATDRERRYRKKLNKPRKPQYNEQALWNTAFYPALEKHKRTDYENALAQLAKFKESVNRMMQEKGLNALIYPHQRVLVAKVEDGEQKGRNGLLAALSGNPAICIPAGFTDPMRSAPSGLPVGIELMGRAGEDQELLDMAEMIEYVLEVNMPLWKTPPGLKRLEAGITEPRDVKEKKSKNKDDYRKQWMVKHLKRERKEGIFRDYSGDAEMEDALEAVIAWENEQKEKQDASKAAAKLREKVEEFEGDENAIEDIFKDVK